MNQQQPHIEPSAEDRAVAAILHGRFVALMQGGFTEAQALTIIGQMMYVASQSGN